MKRGVSLFSGAGIGEAYVEESGIKIIAANELIKRRAELYKSLYPDCNMIQGDITDDENFKKILEFKNIQVLIASPPCQGISIAGKNRKSSDMTKDRRNFLIYKVIDYVKQILPDYVLIENVPLFFKLVLPYNGKLCNVLDILFIEHKDQYQIEAAVMNAACYGVPQTRPRAIIKMFKKGLKWGWPEKEEQISLRQAIGHLPSLESGERSNIPWHYARNHVNKHVLWMKHTPTGKSAFENETFFPQKDDGKIIKGYMSTYRRVKWDEPVPAITIRNDAISSQRNVHPGRLLPDGTYSDARVLTPLEIMILSSLPADWKIPLDTPEILVRQCIGESIPPLLVKKILDCIGS